MAFIDYQVKIFDQFGNFLHELTDYESFEVTRIKNDIGTFSIVLNTINHNVNDYSNDYRAEIYRKGKLVGNTCWLLQRRELVLDDDGKSLITLTFSDMIDVLSRRINAWYSCDNPQCFGALQDLADDMMKMLVQFNFGILVEPESDPVATPYVSPGASPVSVQGIPVAVSYSYDEIYGSLLAHRPMPFDIEDYRSEGVLVASEMSFIDVLSALQDIASISEAIKYFDLSHNIWFDIEYQPKTLNAVESFIFKTWVGVRGNDLRDKIFIGPDYDNLVGAVYTIDDSQRADIAYVLSDGDNSFQVVGVAWLDTETNAYNYSLPFGPIEIVTDFPQDNASEELLEGEGLSVLGAASKTKSLEGQIIVTNNFDFMEHFNYGDLLSLRWGDVQEDIEISEFTISVNSEGVEEITVPLNIL